ncbi:MAG TPA: amidohydrolase family protein [Gemmatimonadales bacterium]|nr:amidohydrolase family protein [Gemmatimonadales bacterium]
MKLSALLLVAVAACAAPETYDVVLANGRVMDPASGLDSIRHLGISGGKIAAISADPLQGDTVVDVSNHVVAPGFIDLHAHGQTTSDMELQAQDGVTTALELEIGVYPVAQWYQSMEGKAPVNYGATVSHVVARFAMFHPSAAIGSFATNRPAVVALGSNPAGANQPTDSVRIDSLAAALRRGLDEGALGVGFGINYTPAASPAEIERMFRVAAERRVPAFVHTRGFGIASIREIIGTAITTGAALHIVHIGSSSIGATAETLALIDSARAAGHDVTTEVYPYTAAATAIESAIFNPGWQENFKIGYGDVAWALTGERLTKASFDRYRKQGGWVIIYMMKEEDVSRAVAHPGVMIASDGVPFVNGTGHPRGAGTFARTLGHYSRDRKVLPLMDALAKMTILPARRLEGHVPAMKNKGRIAIGADADLTVFDPATVIDRATFEQPTLTSAGIPHVMVNGTFVVRDGQLVKGVYPGRAVRTTSTTP